MQTEEIIETGSGEAPGERSAPDVGVPSPTALAAFGLVKSYGKRRVVDEVSLHVEQSEVVGLLGANGAGKTTTFYMMVGLERPNAGRVMLGKREITKLPMYLRARLGLGYLPQEPSVFRKLSVEENILAVLEHMPLRRREQLKRVEELLEEFGIAHVRRTRGDLLSAASAAAPRSRARSPRARPTCCSTSRSPASIRSPWATSSSWCAT
jgi:lipopolysaccharide export system ATP-binding protein